MSKKPQRLKAPAQVHVPASRDDCAADIRVIGDLQREQARKTAAMNDEIAAITARYQPELDELKARLERLQEGVQTWCEANRQALTDNGKVKTANLVTGEVSWRIRPPSVGVRGADAVIETLRRLGLTKFLRERVEINKEAILNEPDEARGIAGITIVSGVEDFAIVPFEQEAP